MDAATLSLRAVAPTLTPGALMVMVPVVTASAPRLKLLATAPDKQVTESDKAV